MSDHRKHLKPAVARIWRGRVKTARADKYEAYLRAEGIPPLEKNALGVTMLRADREAESEFVTISFWESVDAMSRFAGPNPTRIHNLPRDPEFLVELPEGVQVLNFLHSFGTTARHDG